MSYFENLSDDDNPLDVSVLRKKKKKQEKLKPETSALDTLSKSQGWADRQPRKPGPKRREPRTVITMNGPERVLNRFRQYADHEEISQWEALEKLLTNANILP